MAGASKVISADSHILEPPDLWLKHIDPKFRDRAPHVEHRDGIDVFVCDDVQLVPIAPASSAGNKSISARTKGRWEEVVRKGAYDPHERMKDMQLDGLEGEVIYPTQALRMFAIKDPALQRAVFGAYHTWVANFCNTYASKLKGIALISLADVEEAVMEMRRVRKLGLVGLMVSVQPEGATYSGPAYDRFWATAQELDMPVSLHIATNATGMRSLMADISTRSHWAQWSIADLIFNGVPARFPDIKLISAENDAGWAPALMLRMDEVFNLQRSTQEFYIKDKGLRPSEYFRRNVYLSFMYDPPAIFARELIGTRHLLWSSDYPHKETTFPHSQKFIGELFSSIPEQERQLITYENAVRLFGF